jgi:hypothetical protein
MTHTNTVLLGVVLVIAALVVSTLLAWRQYQSRKMARWRNRIVWLALLCNTLSLLVYATEIGWFQFVMRSSQQPRDPGFATSGVLLATFFLISFVAAVGGVFGRGIARVLTTANGVVLCVLWYLVALGTSA